MPRISAQFPPWHIIFSEEHFFKKQKDLRFGGDPLFHLLVLKGTVVYKFIKRNCTLVSYG